MRNIIAPLFVSLITALGSAQADADNRPNILFILADDLGWKDLGHLGSDYYETPHLDRFATQSMRFTQAYAAAANCGPSRACLMSGLNTPRHGVYTVNNSDRGKAATRRITPIANTVDLAPKFKTLGGVLSENGYQTITIGKWHLGEDPTQQGFHENIAGHRRGSPNKSHFSPYNLETLSNGPDGEYLADRLTQEAIDFLDRRDESKPFFLYLPHYAVHTPIQAPEDLTQKYLKKGERSGQRNAKYAAMVENLDTNVGLILDHLESKALSKNTIVIFTSDNGGIRSISTQAPLRAGKGSYYEGGIRVPMAIRWPGKIKANTITDMPTTNLDFYPTLLELAGIEYDRNPFDGDSIASQLLNQKALSERPFIWHFPIYLQAYRPNDDDGRDPLFRTRPGSVIRRGKWKLHLYYEDNAFELYDLQADIGERNNLAESKPEIVSRLHKELVNWIASTEAPVPSLPNPQYDAAEEQRLIKRALSK
ncbi:MAG: sulfatase [Verrucomicrobiota bacterium]